MECTCGAYIDGLRRTCPLCGRLVNEQGVDPSLAPPPEKSDTRRLDREGTHRNQNSQGYERLPHRPTSKIEGRIVPLTENEDGRAHRNKREKKRELWQKQVDIRNELLRYTATGKNRMPIRLKTSAPKSAILRAWIELDVDFWSKLGAKGDDLIRTDLGKLRVMAQLVDSNTVMVVIWSPWFSLTHQPNPGRNAIEMLTAIEAQARKIGLVKVKSKADDQWYATQFGPSLQKE